MDDRELLCAYVERRDERAFASLVERHVTLVYSAALRQVAGDAGRAQEVTQMVFIELARKAASLVSHPVLVGWLHRTTRWKASELRRHDRRRTELQERAGAEWDVTHDGAGPARAAIPGEETVDWKKLGPLLDEAVDDLSVHDREAVLLRYFANWPFAEIGTSLGVSENAARMRVERALEKLRGALAKRGVKSTVVLLGGAISAQGAVTPPAGLVSSTIGAALAAGAPVASGAAVAAGGVLLMTKLSMVGMGVLTLGLAGGVAWQWNANQTAVARMEARATAPRAGDAPPAPEASVPESEPASATRVANVLPATVGETELTPAQLERARLDLVVRKGELDRTHADLFRRLKLPPEKLDQLRTLLVERNQAEFDAGKIAESQGFVFASGAERAEVEAAATAEIDARVKQMLDGSQFDYFQFYQDTRKVRAGLAGYVPVSSASRDANSDLLDELTRRFAADNPDHRELTRGRNGTALPKRLQEFFTTLNAPELAEQAGRARQFAVTAQQMEILTAEAALKGKLKNLTRRSARDFLVPDNKPANP